MISRMRWTRRLPASTPIILTAFSSTSLRATMWLATGKTVILFCTSSSSGLGSSGTLLEQMANGGTWLTGQRFSSGASSSSVREWAAGLGL